MEDYIIGSGVTVTSGEQATITPTALHAHVDPALAAIARAVAIDFEGTSTTAMRRLLLIAPGWNSGTFQRGVTSRLMELGTCGLAEVLKTLAMATGSREVHIFAHWLPDDETCVTLGGAGITLVVHSLDAIEQAALIADQRHLLWPSHRAA